MQEDGSPGFETAQFPAVVDTSMTQIMMYVKMDPFRENATQSRDAGQKLSLVLFSVAGNMPTRAVVI